MYNVLIAEDEFLVRVGLVSTVEWASLRLNEPFTTADGARALDLCLTENIDILITDIRMPELSGLELIKRIRKQNNRMKIIVVTCLEDFSTLHEAFTLGISGYLLKATMTTSELEELLIRVRDELDANREMSLSSSDTVSDLLFKVEESDDIEAVLAVKFDSDNILALRSVRALMLERLSSLGNVQVVEKDRISFFSFLRSAKCSVHAIRVRFTEASKYILDTFSVTSRAIAYSPAGKADFAPVCDIMEELLTKDSFLISGFLRLEDEMKLVMPDFEERISLLRDDEFYFGYRAYAKKDEYMSCLSSLENELVTGRLRFLDSLSRLCNMVFSSNNGIYPPSDKSRSFKDCLYSFPTALEAVDAFIALYPEVNLSSSYSTGVVESTKYIREHLTDNISLSFMANMLGISQNYYASLFKSAVGVNFSEYVGRVRLDKACALLKDKNMSISDVSRSCGFSDVTYFTRYFKSVIGQPPNKWRSRHE
ncbi:MAG: response regulator [Clostridiales bacterium]|jgi:two-component system response regulator YesN|nr:response regulator [Clostridiales bacterium]